MVSRSPWPARSGAASVAGVGRPGPDPHQAVGDRHPLGAVAHRDPSASPRGGGVDARHGPGVLAGHPHPARADGDSPPAPSPTVTVAVTEFVWGSMRDTVPSRLLATHTDPKPLARAVGPVPTWIDAVT